VKKQGVKLSLEFFRFRLRDPLEKFFNIIISQNEHHVYGAETMDIYDGVPMNDSLAFSRYQWADNRVPLVKIM
jgi:hypothetical protein